MPTSPQRRQHPLRRLPLLFASALTLAGAVVVTLGAVASASGIVPVYTVGKQGGSAKEAPTGRKGIVTCGSTGQPACAPMGDPWIAVTSDSPQAILVALQAAPTFVTPARAASAASGSTDALDMPVLVSPATVSNGDSYDLPHFVIRGAVNGVRSILYDVVYDPAQHRMRISSIGVQLRNDPPYGQAFPWEDVAPASAVSLLHDARHINVATGQGPELVYFEPNPALGFPNGGRTWTGGGTSATNPIWRLKGSDGHAYFVGTDRAVYTPGQLPIAPGASVVQP